MERAVRWLAVVIALGSLTWWLAAGANRGWTKTSVPKKTLDEVTGIEGITYEKQFVPGMDVVAVSWLGAGCLFVISVLVRSWNRKRMHHLHTTFQTLIVLAALSKTAVMGAPQTFDFKDPKGVNNITFKLDAPLEAITGSANGITGTVRFDPEKPAATTGKITVAASTLQVPNPMMKGHLHGEQWMEVSKYPEITFEAKELKNVKTMGDNTTADVVGTLTVHGVSKPITVPVKFVYLKDKLGQRVPNMKGDLLVVRSNFSIKRTDFGISPKAPEDRVSDTIEISLSVAGASAR